MAVSKDAAAGSSFDGRLEELETLLGKTRDEKVGLLAEGIQLSRDVGMLNSKVKELRLKIVEHERTINDYVTKSSTQTNDNFVLHEKLKMSREGEKKLAESAAALEKHSLESANIITRLEGETFSSTEKLKSMQLALDRAWEELSETRKTQTESAEAQVGEALEKEIQAGKELMARLEEVKREKTAIQTELQREVSYLRDRLARIEEDAGWKEDNYLKEVNVRVLTF